MGDRGHLGIGWVLFLCGVAAPAVGRPEAASEKANVERPFLVLAVGSEEAVLDLLRTDRPGLPPGWNLEAVRIDGPRARATWRGPGNRHVTLDVLPPDFQGPGVVGRTLHAVLRAPDPRSRPPVRLLRGVLTRLSAEPARLRWERRIHPLAVPAEDINRPRFSPGTSPVAPELEQAREAIRRASRPEVLERLEGILRDPRADRQAIRFGTMLLRSIGEASRAISAWEGNVENPSSPLSFDEIVEWVATLEAAGRQVEAAMVAKEQATAAPERFPSASCLRAEALGRLLREGLSVDGILDSGPLPLGVSGTRPSRCSWLIEMHRATRRGDGEGLVRTARDALDAFPGDRDVLYLWGHFFFVRHRLDEALEPWDRLAVLDPTYPSLMSLYGTAWLVSGRLQRDGIEALLARHRDRPDDAVAAYLAGLGLFYQKEYDRVIPLLSQAAAAVPEDPRPAMYLAMAHFFTGNREEAVRILDDLERFAWQEPDINYCRSLVHRSTDLPRAIREMETFLRVFEGEDRVSFGPQKVQKARSDLERMRRGEVPEVFLPQPDGWDDPVLEVQRRIGPSHPEDRHDPR